MDKADWTSKQWENDTYDRLEEVGVALPETGTPNEAVGKMLGHIRIGVTIGCGANQMSMKDVDMLQTLLATTILSYLDECRNEE